MKKRISYIAILAMVLTLFAAPVYAAPGDNLVTNGDFEAGNTGFDSDYAYLADDPASQTELWPESTYGVGLDPNDYHSSWASFPDHSGHGKMMIVNANPNDPTQIIWGSGDIELPVCDENATSAPLYAGQNNLVGNVLMKEGTGDDEGNICVKFVLNEEAVEAEWFITETHVAIGAAAADIPQKKGNPIPGKFPAKDYYDPAVTETDWICLPFDGENPVIAAHAVVQKMECITVAEAGSATFVSDTTTNVTYPAPGAAVLANAGPYYGADTWINQTGSNGWDPAPSWIWNAYPVVNPVAGDVVWFEKTFNIPGIPDDANITIAGDNAFALWLNGKYVGKSDTLKTFTGADDVYPALGDLGLETLMEANVATTGWAEESTFDLGPYLVEGTNTLKIMGLNEYFNVGDGTNNEPGTILNNPGGLAFSGCFSWDSKCECVVTKSETAWGGTMDFSGKNWANYIQFPGEPVDCSKDFRLTFYVANSFPENPANLEVFINGVSMGHADLGTVAGTGNWLEFTKDWNSGDDTTAEIVIKNTYVEAQGNDFVLDCITFVELP